MFKWFFIHNYSDVLQLHINFNPLLADSSDYTESRPTTITEVINSVPHSDHQIEIPSPHKPQNLHTAVSLTGEKCNTGQVPHLYDLL